MGGEVRRGRDREKMGLAPEVGEGKPVVLGWIRILGSEPVLLLA